MRVLSSSSLSAGSLIWQRRDGGFVLTVVCKATYEFAPGASRLTDPERIAEEDVFTDGDDSRGVYQPSDLVPFKPRADIVLVGSAFAPPGERVRSLVVRLVAGGIDKSIVVVASRAFTRDGQLREGDAWMSMPLTYDRAAGGLDTWNPVGIRADAAPDMEGLVYLPNLQPIDRIITKPGEFVPPVGFGPIAESWLLRREKLGARADHRPSREPLGDDFDAAYFQAAPPDQQVDVLRDDEAVRLVHLHPEHPDLVTRLPGVHPRALVQVSGHASFEIELVADTLWIDTERSLCTLTWRGQLAIDHPDAPGRVLLALEQPGERLSWSAIEKAAMVEAPAAADYGAPADEDAETQTQELPRAESGAASDQEQEVRRAPGSGRPRERTLIISEGPVRPAVLPFRAPGPGDAPPLVSFASAPEPHRRSGSRQDTLTLSNLSPPARMPNWLVKPPSLAAVPSLSSAPAEEPVPAASQGLSRLVSALDDAEAHRKFALYAGAFSPPDEKPERPMEIPHIQIPRAVAPEETPEPAAPPTLQLLWFDPGISRPLSQREAWKSLLAPPPAPRARLKPGARLPEPPTPEDAEDVRRRDVLAVLSKGTPEGTEDLHDRLKAKLREESPPAPLLVLVAGEVEMLFDALEELKMLAAAAAPLAASDRKLKEEIAPLLDLAQGPLLGSPEVIEGLSARVREAWTKANRVLPASYLDTTVERALLEQRRYQVREMFGGMFLRTIFHPAVGGPALPAYLPGVLSRQLPFFRKFPARMLAEAVLRQDPYEAQPAALKAVAVAREDR